jgi:hypothetical protein
MWICKKCSEQNDDNFHACWNCGTSQSGVEDLDFVTEDSPFTFARPARPSLQCLRCQRDLDYIGTRRFHEGTNWGIFGALGELLVTKQSFDVYVCSDCGHVEFFVTGIGESREAE